MASATLIPASQLLLSRPSIARSCSRLLPSNNALRSSVFTAHARRAGGDGGGGRPVVCTAVDAAATVVETKKKSSFELQTLTP